MLHWGLLAAAHRLPFLPMRAGLGSDVLRVNPNLRTVRSPYADGEEFVAVPALPLDAALVHLNRADARGQRPVPRSGPVLRRPVLPGGRARLRVMRADRADRGAAGRRAAAEPADQPRDGARCGRDAERRALHQLRARLRPGRGVPGQVCHARPRARRPGRKFAAEYLSGGEGGYQAAVARLTARAAHDAGADGPGRTGRERERGEPTLAEVCVVACAEAWRGDGEILASPIGLIPTLGARLAQLTFEPDLLLTDGEATLLAPADGRRGHGSGDGDRVTEGWLPFRSVFTCWRPGRRHVMMGAAQLDQFGNQNISCIGDWARPKAQLLGVRGAPGNTVNHPVSYWVPQALAPGVRRPGRHGLRRRLRPGRGPARAGGRRSTSCGGW